MQAAHFGFRIAEVPARTRYFEDASLDRLRPATVYGLKTLWAARGSMLHRSGLLRSRKFQPVTRHRRARHRPRPAASTRPGSATSPPTRCAALLPAGPRARPRLRRSGTRYDLLAPRETVGVDLDAEALAGQDRETVVADMRELPFAGRELRRRSSSVQSIEHVPDPERVLAEVRARARAGRHRHLRDPQPAHVRPPRRDHRPLPLRRVRPAPAASRCATRYFETRRAARAVRLASATRAGGGRAAQARPAAAPRPAAAAPVGPAARAPAALRPQLRRERAGDDPRPPRSSPTTSRLATRGSTRRSTSLRSARASGAVSSAPEERPGESGTRPDARSGWGAAP